MTIFSRNGWVPGPGGPGGGASSSAYHQEMLWLHNLQGSAGPGAGMPPMGCYPPPPGSSVLSR